MSSQDGQTILNIVGERVALGPLRRELLPLNERWINDLVTARNLGPAPRPQTSEQERAWYDRAATDEDASFAIYARGAGDEWRPIGTTTLGAIDYRNRTATFGIMIGEPGYRGRGCGTEATRLVLDYAFTALGLHNVLLTVFAFNPAGQRAYEKAGFRALGRRREALMMGGRLWDVIYMECLATEFDSPVLGKVFAPDAPRP